MGGSLEYIHSSFLIFGFEFERVAEGKHEHLWKCTKERDGDWFKKILLLFIFFLSMADEKGGIGNWVLDAGNEVLPVDGCHLLPQGYSPPWSLLPPDPSDLFHPSHGRQTLHRTPLRFILHLRPPPSSLHRCWWYYYFFFPLEYQLFLYILYYS